jgi:acyl-CoA thioester hydrolase
MLEVFRSSVNTWDCDHMGHLNVRHYFGRANDALSVLLLELGLSPRTLRERGWLVRARDQHIRFSQELRPGSAYSLHAGVVRSEPSLLTVYEELRTAAGAVSATIVSDVALLEVASGESVAWPPALLLAARALHCVPPPQAAPRGVAQVPTRTRPTRQSCIQRGLVGAFLGPLLAEDCDAQGVMREAACMGRVADGIGHFFHVLQGGARPSGIGGAAVEYRYVFHAWPQRADIIEVRSGLIGLGNKTLHMAHFLFNVENGACFAAAEAVAVWFDLTARKAVAMPDALRTLVEARVMPDLQL